MLEKVSILHISDIHRSKGGEISNQSLLTSLITDKDNYTTRETPVVQSPDLIVVSGDMIRGSVSDCDSDKEIQEQYDEVRAFLTDLAEELLDGKKDHVVIIPGNHDIDWKCSRESMQKLDAKNIFDGSNSVKSQILRDSMSQHSNIRWSWKDLSFYEIHDQAKYSERIKAFSKFYGEFYEGSRSFSLNPEEQYDIFDFAALNLTVVGFNSCYQNDHLRFVGNIHPDCLAKSTLALRSYRAKGRLILATWHHNTKGPPHDVNYMDDRVLKSLIDSGVTIGFHGHQHRTEIIHEISDVIERKKLVVLSAGTLCGGPAELPAGNNRQYNVVEINWNSSDGEDDSVIKVTLHTREKSESSSFDNPIWRPGRIDSNLVSYHTFDVERPMAQNSDSSLLEIEKLIEEHEYVQAKQGLLNLDIAEPFVRKFLAKCVIETDDFQLALEVLSPPQTDEELVIVLNAAIEMVDKVRMAELQAAALHSGSPAVKELLTRIEAILK